MFLEAEGVLTDKTIWLTPFNPIQKEGNEVVVVCLELWSPLVGPQVS